MGSFAVTNQRKIRMRVISYTNAVCKECNEYNRKYNCFWSTNKTQRLDLITK